MPMGVRDLPVGDTAPNLSDCMAADTGLEPAELERRAGFEPATSSVEQRRPTNWATGA